MNKKFIWLGAILGFGVWLIDNDLFLNAGGASARISNFILRTFGLSSLGYPLIIIFPPLVLIICGMILGLIGGKTRSEHE